MKKVLTLSLAALMLAALLGGCTGRLPDGMDKAKLESLATEVVDLVNARDYATLVGMYIDEGPTEDEWPELLEPYTETYGAFKEYKKISYVTTEDDTYGELVTMLVEADYENIEQIWQVYITTDYKIAGLRISKA